MSNSRLFTCVCGATFDNWSKYGGHKQSCTAFIIDKYGSIGAYNKVKNKNHYCSSSPTYIERKKKRELANQLKEEQWIAEQHRCERCGKIMTTKFESGRFCSIQCCNSHPHSPASKKKISIASKAHAEKTADKRAQNKKALIDKYERNPSRCKICNAPLPYEKRELKACSKECENELHRRFRNDYIDKYGLGKHNTKHYKYGTYKGVKCDSSWELAFVMYHIDHNIAFTRNTLLSFTYDYEEKTHRYFPDFIVGNVIIEIKGQDSDEARCKAASVPDSVAYKLLLYNDMKPYIKYAEKTYGKDFYKLYDKDQPSWMDINK